MKSNNIFDFEKPIVELEKRLFEMKKIAAENDVEVDSATLELDKKIHDLKVNIYSNLSRWQRVQISRHAERPYSLDYIENITDEFQELFGDRNFKSVL